MLMKTYKKFNIAKAFGKKEKKVNSSSWMPLTLLARKGQPGKIWLSVKSNENQKWEKKGPGSKYRLNKKQKDWESKVVQWVQDWTSQITLSPLWSILIESFWSMFKRPSLALLSRLASSVRPFCPSC